MLSSTSCHISDSEHAHRQNFTCLATLIWAAEVTFYTNPYIQDKYAHRGSSTATDITNASKCSQAESLLRARVLEERPFLPPSIDTRTKRNNSFYG